MATSDSWREQTEMPDFTADGRLQQFEWTITRRLKEDGTPRILQLESPKLSLRLVFDQITYSKSSGAAGQCAARVGA